MVNNYTLLTDLLEKAIRLSKQCIHSVDTNEIENLADMIATREKIINVILTIHERLDLEQNNLKNSKEREFALEFNNQVNLLIVKISELDDELMVKLSEEKDKTQLEIAKVFKNKENLKGYNLNCLK